MCAVISVRRLTFIKHCIYWIIDSVILKRCYTHIMKALGKYTSCKVWPLFVTNALYTTQLRSNVKTFHCLLQNCCGSFRDVLCSGCVRSWPLTCACMYNENVASTRCGSAPLCEEKSRTEFPTITPCWSLNK